MMSDHHSSNKQLLLAEKEHAEAVALVPNQMPKHYAAAELNALCNIDAPMPAEMLSWEQMKDIGKEALPNV